MKEKLPENLDDWNLGTVTNLLHSGYYESDILELKENLHSENEGIAKTCCAFANTNGGFFICGISDNRSIEPLKRIIGLDKSKDNIVLITNQLSNIYPQLQSTDIRFSDTPIDLGNNKELILFEIKPSKSLHQFQNKFYKRLQGKNEPIPYEEIKTKFIENQRSQGIQWILISELSITNYLFKKYSKYEENGVTATFDLAEYIKTNALYNFLFEQSYFYSDDLLDTCVQLLEIITKLKNQEEDYKTFNVVSDTKTVKDFLKQSQSKTVAEHIVKNGKYLASMGIQLIKNIEDQLKVKIPEPDELKYVYPKQIK